MAICAWKLMVVVALTGCDTWGFREPGAAIDGADDGGMFRFSFRECGRRQSFSPRHVAVFDVTGPGVVPACRTRSNYVASGPWRYGDGQRDQLSPSACLPSTAGRISRVETSGAGGGYLRFRIAGDGRIVPDDKSCPQCPTSRSFSATIGQ